MVKLTFEEVKQRFTEKKYTLLSTEYIGYLQLLQYKCNNCSFEHKLLLNNLIKSTHSCKNCRIILHRKEMFNRIKKKFQENNCELLETEYVNNRTKMNYRCNCGNNSEITFINFNHGKRCMKCSGKEKYTYDYVKKCFEDVNYELLETEYINSSTKMKYRCDKNHLKTIIFANFKHGYRCRKCCGLEKLTIEYAKKYFQNVNYELLETEYINNSTKMKYRCNNNHFNSMTDPDCFH
jgi:hypothetical protein